LNRPGRLAIVEDDRELLEQLRWALASRFEVRGAGDGVSARELFEGDPEVFLIDLRLPPSNTPEEGLKLLAEIRERKPEAAVIVMTGETDRRYALRAVEMGAYDFFYKPVESGELLLILGRALERQRLRGELRILREESASRQSFEKMIGQSPPMRDLFRDIEKIAGTDATVLVQGESGTGKELVAQSIHRLSGRANRRFVAVNSSALPETLAESELFGHEKGAFTGAISSRPGRFELAEGGTLFLDEVATLSPAVQAKLLRALETRVIERVGSGRPTPVDIRLIAASNEDLEERVAAGAFREDLLYRLNTVTLRVPALRERPQDIPALCDFFAERAARQHRRPTKRFLPATLEAFGRHRWPGNVRELEHLVEMLTLMVEEEEIAPSHLPGALRDRSVSSSPGSSGRGRPWREAVAEFERDYLKRAIEGASGNRAAAGRGLGLNPHQMKYLCQKYKL
jgi:DNA-binding NtrC family response regulator